MLGFPNGKYGKLHVGRLPNKDEFLSLVIKQYLPNQEDTKKDQMIEDIIQMLNEKVTIHKEILQKLDQEVIQMHSKYGDTFEMLLAGFRIFIPNQWYERRNRIRIPIVFEFLVKPINLALVSSEEYENIKAEFSIWDSRKYFE